MKRYTIEITSTDMGVGAAPGLRAIESETHGEWVRAEDALARVAELEAVTEQQAAVAAEYDASRRTLWEQTKRLEAERDTERSCRLAAEAELQRADAAIGGLRFELARCTDRATGLQSKLDSIAAASQRVEDGYSNREHGDVLHYRFLHAVRRILEGAEEKP